MKTLNELLDTVKRHPDFSKCGMVLCHNGVVRDSARDGRNVSGLRVTVDHEKLARVLAEHKKRPGIVEILIDIQEGRDLSVGDDVMFIVVAGDIRENVIAALTDILNIVKSTVTQKTQFFA